MHQSITISIKEEDAESISRFCELAGLNRSKLFIDYASTLGMTIRAAGLDKKKKISRLDLVKLLGRGLSTDVG